MRLTYFWGDLLLRFSALSAVLLLSLLIGSAQVGQAQSPTSQAGPLPAGSETTPTIELEPCHLRSDGEEVLCGWLEVPENRAMQDSRTLSLRVVVLPAKGTKSDDSHRRALFVLAGGPGVAATRWGPGFVGSVFPELRQSHDVVLVDQRGTGESNPLGCDLYGAGQPETLWGDLLPAEAIQQCRRQLEVHSDLSQYGTAVAMDDLEQVRLALGYSKIDLYGGSYGTQAALVYLRRYPDAVRSAVLMGVAPTTVRGLEEIPKAAQASLDRLLELCAVDEACQAAYPELRRQLEDFLQRLRKGPLQVDVTVPDGERRTLPLTYDNFALVLRGLLHHAPAAARIPLVVQSAAEGDFEPFAAASFAYRGAVSRSVAFGMFLSVFCEEQVRHVDRAAAAEAAQSSFAGDYWTAQLVGACKIWPPGQLPEGFHRPVSSQVPVLLIAGGLDPATPPHWARQAAALLPNSHVLDVPYASHSIGGAMGCVDQIATRFLLEGSGEGLDASCVEQLEPVPFALPPQDASARAETRTSERAHRAIRGRS